MLAVIIILYIPNIIPCKFAVKENQLKNKDNYILVKMIRTTGFNWGIVGDQNGRFVDKDGIEYMEFVELKNNIPVKNYGAGVFWGDNTYVCYGEFTGEGDFYGEEYRIFTVTDWDILFPITRNALRDIIPTPNGYLSLYDFID